MKRLIQSVSLFLALLLLAPLDFAQMRCRSGAQSSDMGMCCCGGMMHGSSMPMTGAEEHACKQASLAAPACCTTTATDLSLPASLTEAQPLQSAAPAIFALLLAPLAAPTPQWPMLKHPPGSPPLRQALTSLCFFLI